MEPHARAGTAVPQHGGGLRAVGDLHDARVCAPGLPTAKEEGVPQNFGFRGVKLGLWFQLIFEC